MKFRSLSEHALALDEFPDVMEGDGMEENEEAGRRVAEDYLKMCEDDRR